ncbi:hypothetical protein TUM17384_14500 [Shewanella algae]|nr:hypothetical protein TUM17384_14500 [Shewanella algae]
MAWMGYDYYEQIGDDSYLLPKSKMLHNELKSTINFQKVKSEILRYYFKFRLMKVVGRIDYFAPVIVDEYFKVRDFLSLPSFPELVSWNYGTIEETIG